MAGVRFGAAVPRHCATGSGQRPAVDRGDGAHECGVQEVVVVQPPFHQQLRSRWNFRAYGKQTTFLFGFHVQLYLKCTFCSEADLNP